MYNKLADQWSYLRQVNLEDGSHQMFINKHTLAIVHKIISNRIFLLCINLFVYVDARSAIVNLSLTVCKIIWLIPH